MVRKNSSHKREGVIISGKLLISVVAIVLLFALLLTVFLIKNNSGFTANAVSDFIGDIKDFFGISALIGTSVSRSFLVSEYTGGTPFVVKLSVNIDPADKIINYGIEEVVPSGWTVVSINSTDYYSVNGQKISWIVNSSNNRTYLSSRELYYTVAPLSSDTGSKTFSSNAAFTSVRLGNPSLEQTTIQGSTSISSVVDTNTGGNSGGGSRGGGGGSKPTTTNYTTSSSGNSSSPDSPIIDINEPADEDNGESKVEVPSGDTGYSSMIYVMLVVIFALIAGLIITVIILRRKGEKQELVRLI